MSQSFPPAQPPSSQPEQLNTWAPPAAGQDPAWAGVTPAQPPKQRGRTVAIVAASAVAAVAVIGGGTWAALGALGGGGAQPEQRVPSSAVAFAEVDLNPSLEQKLDALRFARKLPDVDEKDVREDSDLRQVIYEGFTEDMKGAPPWSRAKEWVGDRAAIAALPSTGEDPFEPVILLAVKNDDRARTDLGKIHEDDLAVAVKDGWAVLAQTKAVADRVAATTKDTSLANSQAYQQDLDRLGDVGIVSAWYDGPGLATAAKAYAKARPSEGMSSTLPGALDSLDQLRDQLGHGAATLRFSGPQLELAAVATGTKLKSAPAGTELDRLPADSLVALSLSGLGRQLTEAWPAIKAQGGDALAEETGLTLPQDLAALFGERTQFVLAKGEGEMPDFGLKVASQDARTPKALDIVLSQAGDSFPLQRKDIPGGYVLATTPKQADALASGGGLGSAAGFKDVLPDLGSAQSAAYVNLAGLAGLGGMDADDAKALKALGAAGLTASVDGDGVARLSLRIGTR